MKRVQSTGTPYVCHQEYSCVSLPDELLLKIFQNLSFSTVESCSLTCKRIYEFVSSRDTLFKMCWHYGLDEKSVDLKKICRVYSNLTCDDCQSSFIRLAGKVHSCVALHNKVYAIVQLEYDQFTPGMADIFFSQISTCMRTDLEFVGQTLASLIAHATARRAEHGMRYEGKVQCAVLEILDLKTLERTTLFLPQTAAFYHLGVYKEMLVLGFEDGHTMVWDPQEKRCVAKCQLPWPLSCLVADPERKRIILSWQDQILLWEVNTGSLPISIMKVEEEITALVLDQDTVIVGTSSGEIAHVNLTTKVCTLKAQGWKSAVKRLVIYNDRLFLFGEEEALVKVWDRKTLALLDNVDLSGLISLHESDVYDYLQCFPWGGKCIVVTELNKERDGPQVAVWDPTTNRGFMVARAAFWGPEIFYDGKLIGPWNDLGLRIQDYSLSDPERQIKYPVLAHLGCVSKNEVKEKLCLEPEDLYKNLRTDADYKQFLELCKPLSTISPLKLLSAEDVETTGEEEKRLYQRAGELEQASLDLRCKLSAVLPVTKSDYREMLINIVKAERARTGKACSVTRYNALADDLNRRINEFHDQREKGQRIFLRAFLVGLPDEEGL
jgi:hypothetical protein